MRVIFSLLVLFALAACGAEPKWASDEAVSKAIYVHEGPPTITLFTVIGNRTGAGAHSALMINGSQRVLFDPAGTWHHPRLPERNDVHFGITDVAVDFYIDYHARITYHVIEQDLVVSPEIAELALREAQAYGAVPKAMCSVSVTNILARLPGFESIGHTWNPKAVARDFGKLPGVVERKFYDDSPEENGEMLVHGL